MAGKINPWPIDLYPSLESVRKVHQREHKIFPLLYIYI